MYRFLYILFISFIFSERGDLISYQYIGSMESNNIQEDLDESVGQLNPEAIFNIKAYSIVYETIGQFGEYQEASGFVSFPANYHYGYPMYLFGHGTKVKRNSAPSNGGFNDLNKWLGTSGYIYMEPDYLGLGVSQVNHPYQLKDPTASAMIDMVYATKQFCDQINGLQYNDQLYIAGYSEGGYATLAAVKEIEENYPDINITMSFPMAGAYDMSGTMVDLMLSKERYVNPYYLPYVLLSYIERYNLGDPDDFFTPYYAEILPELFNGEYSGGYINNFMPDIPIYILRGDVIYDFRTDPTFPFKITLEQNDLIDWIPQNKLYLFHGIGDEQIPYQNSVVAYNKFIENGADENLIQLELLSEGYGGHNEAAPYCLYGAFILSEEEKYYYIKGDINLDNQLDMLDLIDIKFNVKNSSSISTLEFWFSDFNNDGLLNMFDIYTFINKVLEN